MTTAPRPEFLPLADELVRRWQACRALPVDRRDREDDQYLDARERLLALLTEHGIDRAVFVAAVS